MTESTKVDPIFKNHPLDGVIHFAALKSSEGSKSKPMDYFYNNILSTIVLSQLCLKYGVDRFVFSSSASVYGHQVSPLKETMSLKSQLSPYGETKVMGERILKDTARANDSFSVSLLRYFNPIGAHESGLIGEDPRGLPSNLMPRINKVAKGALERLPIFGGDYETPDGTGVRDYIHVVDLAKGHVKAIEKLREDIEIYNLGTGKGTSVLELIHVFEKENQVKVPFEIVHKRPGDIPVSYTDPTKARVHLNWKAEIDLRTMVRDAWNFEKIVMTTIKGCI